MYSDFDMINIKFYLQIYIFHNNIYFSILLPCIFLNDVIEYFDIYIESSVVTYNNISMSL